MRDTRRISAWGVLVIVVIVVLVGLAATHPIAERQLSIREQQNLVDGDLVPDGAAAIGIAEALMGTPKDNAGSRCSPRPRAIKKADASAFLHWTLQSPPKGMVKR